MMAAWFVVRNEEAAIGDRLLFSSFLFCAWRMMFANAFRQQQKLSLMHTREKPFLFGRFQSHKTAASATTLSARVPVVVRGCCKGMQYSSTVQCGAAVLPVRTMFRLLLPLLYRTGPTVQDSRDMSIQYSTVQDLRVRDMPQRCTIRSKTFKTGVAQ